MTLPSETQGEFSVCQFFADGTNEYIKRFCGDKEAVDTAEDFIGRPAAKIGIIQRIIITDGGDFCCFQWEYGKGITFK